MIHRPVKEPIYLIHLSLHVRGFAKNIQAFANFPETHRMKIAAKSMLSLLLFISASFSLADDESHKPFVLASSNGQDLAASTRDVVKKLEQAGFEIAGQYSPVPDTNIIVATSEDLKAAAAGTPRGGYAAGQRISVTEANGGVEVSFVNPVYIQHAYRLEADLQPVLEALTAALGNERFCGAGNKKMTARKLRKYNYMMGMQKFDDPSELGSFDSFDSAVAAVENGLAKEGDGLTQVYRIDIPGREQAVIGIGMRSTGAEDENIDEAYQMNIVDFEGCRKRAYFPYEVLVNGSEVEALHMRFRMAVHFPDLNMMGKHGFTKLMPFPGAIEAALEDMVNAD
jgi:hypothetical protein